MNIWSVTAGSNVPSKLARYAADCVDRRRTCDTQMPLYHAPVDFAFVTDDDAKMLKNATFIIAYKGLP